jgi:hypothetical protein
VRAIQEKVAAVKEIATDAARVLDYPDKWLYQFNKAVLLFMGSHRLYLQRDYSSIRPPRSATGTCAKPRRSDMNPESGMGCSESGRTLAHRCCAIREARGG